jgi:hypothetical protein
MSVSNGAVITIPTTKEDAGKLVDILKKSETHHVVLSTGGHSTVGGYVDSFLHDEKAEKLFVYFDHIKATFVYGKAEARFQKNQEKADTGE